MKPKPQRRTHKFWLPYAWAVRALIERGYGVTDAVRAVLVRGGMQADPDSVNCLRVVYYKVRKQMWPANLMHLRGTVKPPTLTEAPDMRAREPERTGSGESGIDDFEV